MLIVDGLKEAGEELLARDISHKFINLCRSSGFAENFDALSGEGLRDRAYTWTSQRLYDSDPMNICSKK